MTKITIDGVPLDNILREQGIIKENVPVEYQLSGELVGGDPRYLKPKTSHGVPIDIIEETIESTEIYKQAKQEILEHQQGQVGYGISKYPEPLNADTWTVIETIDHIIDESIDKLHYLVMLRIKLKGDSETHRPFPDLKKLMEEARKEEE